MWFVFCFKIKDTLRVSVICPNCRYRNLISQALRAGQFYIDVGEITDFRTAKKPAIQGESAKRIESWSSPWLAILAHLA